jgi:protocatechuate 3,4-dioxygenase beta subunit
MYKRRDIYCLICTFLNLILISPPVLSETCKPTEQMSQGTHYKPITLQKINIGQGLYIKGTVLSATDCSPIENARIEHWQTNSNGKYVDELRAYLLSDTNGKFEFETEWPAAPVPHIHFIIHAEGHIKLVTQWIGSEKLENINLKLVLESLQE